MLCSFFQAKQAKWAAPMPFHEREQLLAGDMIPSSFDRAIMNRAFKRRVIQLVLERLPLLVDLAPGEQLIVDYMGAPVRYTHGGGPPSAMTEFEALGEADLKFFRYAERYGSLLVMATDSDYLPIAMLRLHMQFRERQVT